MRTVSDSLRNMMASLNRIPVTEVVIRDMYHRWSDQVTNAWSTYYPSATGTDGLPLASVDIGWNGVDTRFLRVWANSAYFVMSTGMTTQWQTPVYHVESAFNVANVPAENQRQSVVDGTIHYFGAKGGSILQYTAPTGAVTVNATWATAYPVATYTDGDIALAAVSSTVCYLAKLHEATDHKVVRLSRHTSAANEDGPQIVVSADYGQSSLTWFDAVTLDGVDILIVNTAPYGAPVIVRYEDGVWSDPLYIYPQDENDEDDFLRLGWATVLTDALGEDIIVATGRIGFGGSTGLHPQAYDLMMVSKDGIHWGMDRYGYLGSTARRGKIIEDGGYLYYPGGATIRRATETYYFGNDAAGLKWDVSNAILQAGLTQGPVDASATGDLVLADNNGDYMPYRDEDDSERHGIWPGYQAFCTSGYGDAATTDPIAENTGISYGGSASEDAIGYTSGQNWANPSNVLASADAATAQVYSGSPTAVTSNLLVQGFGFAVPDQSTIAGIGVEILRCRTSTGAPSGTPQDNDVYLLKAGSAVGDDKASSDAWPDTTPGAATYGGAADRWGTTWTPAEINAAEFGVKLRAQVTGGIDGFAMLVYSIRVTVYYSHSDSMRVEHSTHGIDLAPASYTAGDRSVQFQSRDIALRALKDWRAPQCFQWLSRQKHYDPCTSLAYLYSVGGAVIELPDADNDSVTATADEDIVVADADGYLDFDTYNKAGIMLCTKPFDTVDFVVGSQFSFEHDTAAADAHTRPWGLTNKLWLDEADGALAYSGTNITDDGQDFSEWDPVDVNGTDYAKYMIVVVNTDGTVSWGWMHVNATATTGVVKQGRAETADAGFNGSTITDKTPSRYYIQHRNQRLGFGAGVVGCVQDENNLVAAFLDMGEYPSGNSYLYLMARIEDDDADAGFIWVPLARSSSVTQTNMVEGTHWCVDLERRGDQFRARCWYYHPTTAERTAGGDTGWYAWDLATEMVGQALDDRGKVGVILNMSVPETTIERCQARSDHIAVQAGLWDVPDVRNRSTTWDWNDWVAGATKPPLIMGDESLVITGRTASLVKSKHYSCYSAVGFVYRVGSGSPPYSTYGDRVMGHMQDAPSDNYYDDDGAGLYHILAFVAHGHVGNTYEICTQDNNESPYYDSFYPSRGDQGSYTEPYALHMFPTNEAWEQIQADTTGNHASYFYALPGFFCENRRQSADAVAHGLGTVVRQHWDEHILLHSVWANDQESDKTLEWVMKDIATLSGVMDFTTGYSVNQETLAIPAATAPTWLLDTDGDQLFQRDFDITIDLGATLAASDELLLIARASSAFTAVPTGSVADLDAVKLIYKNTAGVWHFLFYQASAESDAWVEVDDVSHSSDFGGERIRFVGQDRFFSIYVNDRHVHTFTYMPINGLNADGYSDDLLSRGYIGLYRVNGATWATVDVTQPELYTWTDAVVMDEQMAAADALARSIQDRRIHWVGEADGSLKISQFQSRDVPQSVDSEQGSLTYPDSETFDDDGQDFADWETTSGNASYALVVINSDGSITWGFLGAETTTTVDVYTDLALTVAGFNGAGSGKTPSSYHVLDALPVGTLLYSDSTGITDRVPTHMRAVGYEISDYVDHDAAVEYGVLFSMMSAPSLEEGPAYLEASLRTQDALSASGGRQISSGAQLHWEAEDEVFILYMPADGGPEVVARCIVNTVSFQASPGSLIMQASLREVFHA